MSDNTAWIFPRTLPQESILTPLVHVFPSIVYLQSIEDDPDSAFKDQPMVQAMVDSGRLKLWAAAPLGEARHRFLSLVSDLRNRRDDYRAMLSSLVLANMTTGNQSESRHAILSQLVGSAAPSNKTKEDAKDMLLWQARLVLKLGEMLDSEQEEIARELQALSRQQQNLFNELREETGEHFSLTRDIGQTTHASDEMLDHRLKAWSQILYFGGNHPVNGPKICITTRSESLERIKDQYETMTRSTCPKDVHLKLPVPVTPTSAPSGPTDVPAPSSTPGEICRHLLLEPEKGTDRIDRLIGAWERECEQLDGQTRSPGGEGARLILQPFPRIQADRLLLETFSNSAADRDDRNDTGGCIVGVLEV